MQFMFAVKGHGTSLPQTLSTDRLIVVAARETAHRTRHVRDRDRKPYGSAAPLPVAPLQLSCSRLRDLCWSASRLSAALSREKDDLTFHCVVAQTPYATRRNAADAELETVPLRVIAADALEHVYLSVHDDLLQPGRLVVFTYAESLLHVGIDAGAWAESRAAAAAAAAAASAAATASAATVGADGGVVGGASPAVDTGAGAGSTPSAKQPRRGDPAWVDGEPPHASRRLDALHAQRSVFKKEPVLAVVPAAVSGDDIKELNELIDDGKLSSLDASLTDYFCCQCYHLPLLTLTMSCCGAVLCQRCAPTPPTVEGVSAADRACPVCGEEPLDPPLSHPGRDGKVAKLVKELKVLYMPQLRALRESTQVSADPSTPSTPPYLLPHTPVLGPPR
ncbi:hypothetical protein NESM_000289700 [Novymonas esmeraldas]|uniref:RING-type domain-containing protein n=1 Tax=Novymonas esmeraldas TaxID=1808958 RepID=A0AAW0FC06_9TRYP